MLNEFTVKYLCSVTALQLLFYHSWTDVNMFSKGPFYRCLNSKSLNVEDKATPIATKQNHHKINLSCSEFIPIISVCYLWGGGGEAEAALSDVQLRWVTGADILCQLWHSRRLPAMASAGLKSKWKASVCHCVYIKLYMLNDLNIFLHFCDINQICVFFENPTSVSLKKKKRKKNHCLCIAQIALSLIS